MDNSDRTPGKPSSPPLPAPPSTGCRASCGSCAAALASVTLQSDLRLVCIDFLPRADAGALGRWGGGCRCRHPWALHMPRMRGGHQRRLVVRYPTPKVITHARLSFEGNARAVGPRDVPGVCACVWHRVPAGERAFTAIDSRRLAAWPAALWRAAARTYRVNSADP